MRMFVLPGLKFKAMPDFPMLDLGLDLSVSLNTGLDTSGPPPGFVYKAEFFHDATFH